ncbi:MAG: aminoacetone oxidase family FAD-binding enzyme [Oscillospiraceae bacterium]|nr:aminoacetone oxidase family FAD-binding enzyme [Oscillospiraceae bacterium]
MIYDLIIIGAGAAGLFAAANVPPGHRVLVLEKTAKPGQKLLLAGSGQGNLTNSRDIKEFLHCYGPNGKRLRSVLFPFSNRALMAYLEAQGLPLITRPDGKVFPASLDAKDVLTLFLTLAGKNGVEFRYHAPVTALSPSEATKGRYELKTSAHTFYTENVLVSTGGASFSHTGSDGGFFDCLAALDIPLSPLRPALVPVHVYDYPYTALSGIAFPDCGFEIRGGAKPIVARDSLLLTHRSFSGPVVLNNARYLAQGTEICINYLPNTNQNALRQRLLTAAKGSPKQIGTLLESETLLPRRFLDAVCERADIATHTKAARLGGSEMGQLAALLTADAYTVSGTGSFQTAMATAGGVCLDGVDLQTLSARHLPGLYFAGEVLDVDGDTGGYNLQFAFSSAKLVVGKVFV